MSALLDRVDRDAVGSNSPIGFETTGTGAWPVWNRYLTVEGKRAYDLGNICGTCRYLFERLEGATKTIDVGRLNEKLEIGITQFNEDLIEPLLALMPAGHYQVLLLRMFPRRVELGSLHDYFVSEQIENEGEADPFWGIPHYPRVSYYRSRKQDIDFDRGRRNGPRGSLFEFVVPMFPERGLDPERTAHYEVALLNGREPTMVALGVLDVKGPAMRGIDHWCLAHYVLDGHHKLAAAARLGRPLTIISFLAVDHGVSSGEEIDAAIDALFES